MLPSLFVRASSKKVCWICQSTTSLSREHKIKASDLRRHFGKTELYIGSDDDGNPRGKLAQSYGSDRLKFESTICERCNNSVTQESDRAYDQFIRQIESGELDIEEVYRVFADARFCRGPELASYIPLFRYFGKILGCQLADSGAPIPIQLSRFVRKKSNRNCIWLGMRPDAAYQRLSESLPNEKLRYAAHGGLLVITKQPRLLPTRIHSTLTIGAVQFFFFFVLTPFQVWEMRMRHPEFIEVCAKTARDGMNNPISQSTMEKLG